jgi:hypothetical protein
VGRACRAFLARLGAFAFISYFVRGTPRGFVLGTKLHLKFARDWARRPTAGTVP